MLQIVYYPANFNIVDKKSKLPAAVGGVITLPADSNWVITGSIDLAGDRIVCAGTVALHGVSAETCVIKSTGLAGADALITTTYTLQIQSVALVSETAPLFDIDGAGTAALDWHNYNIIDTPNIGVIKNIANFINSVVSFLNSGNLILDGTAGTAAYSNSSFLPPLGVSAFVLASTFVCTRRLRFVDCAFIIAPTSNAITYTAGASVPIDQLLIRGCNFSGGSADYVLGITAQSNTSDWTQNKGIDNSANYGEYSMEANIVPTEVLSVLNYYKILGTTTAGTLQRFAHSNNRLTYAGEVTRTFSISAAISIQAGNNNICKAVIRHFNAAGEIVKSSAIPDITTNGAGRAENVALQLTSTFNLGDYLEIWARNTSSLGGVTVSALSLIANIA